MTYMPYYTDYVINVILWNADLYQPNLQNTEGLGLGLGSGFELGFALDLLKLYTWPKSKVNVRQIQHSAGQDVRNNAVCRT